MTLQNKQLDQLEGAETESYKKETIRLLDKKIERQIFWIITIPMILFFIIGVSILISS